MKLLNRVATVFFSMGGAHEEAMVLFRAFRGRDADIAPLLERRGLN